MDSTPDLVAKLEELVAQGPSDGYPSHIIRVSRDFFDSDWTYEEVDALHREFAAEFRSLVEHVSVVWGAPDFIGGYGSDGFPEESLEDEVALWRRGDVLAQIFWGHQDKELPVALGCHVSPADMPESERL